MTELRVGEMLGEILSGLAREIARGSGPVKWCRCCGREHPRRQPCNLVNVAVEAKSGRMVQRLVAPSRDSE